MQSKTDNIAMLNFYVVLHLIQTPYRDFIIKISALEIYNEVVRDLLNPDSGPLRLLDDPEVCGPGFLLSPTCF